MGRDQELQATLKAMEALLAKAHAVAEPILARWKAEEERKKAA